MYDPSQPYVSARSPVAARNMVATSQPLAVQSGIQAMRRGGNAVDAALAAAITLTVVEPNNNGLGSDAHNRGVEVLSFDHINQSVFAAI